MPSSIVDGTVRRVATDYDDMGRVESVTNYSDTVGTTVVNQIEYAYNGWGKLYREYEEHDGAVDGNTPFIQYDYDDGASGGVAKYTRLEKVTYPDGREINYDYNHGTDGATDEIMSRLSAIYDDVNDDGDIDVGEDVYASYKYLGTGRIVVEDYEDIEVKLDYTSNDFAALDRFGRVTDQIWNDCGASQTLDHYCYTYDRAGNRTSRDNELHAAFDEDYTYDDLDRLTDSDRADTFDQSWTLDGQGNFSAFDDDGTSQTRAVNEANEIETITGGWITPTYDAAGNMISGPAPGDETTRVHYVYDAWNRLVEVREDDSGSPGDLIAEYEYDGLNRRVEKIVDEGVSHSHYYYNQNWQMLEAESVDGQGATVARDQYVWSASYVDSPVVRFHDDNGDGDLEDAGDNTRYYTRDANHNVTATIDAATGAVAERYVYTSYGEATVYDSNWSNPSAPTEDGPLYCGYFFDAETSLYQVRNRYYDSSLSTFISRDPIGYLSESFNLYEYVNGNPLTYRDPYGRKPQGTGRGVMEVACDVTTGKQHLLPGNQFPNLSHPCYLAPILAHESVHIADCQDACNQAKDAYDKMVKQGIPPKDAEADVLFVLKNWEKINLPTLECRAYSAGCAAAIGVALTGSASPGCCEWATRAMRAQEFGKKLSCPNAKQELTDIDNLLEIIIGN